MQTDINSKKSARNYAEILSALCEVGNTKAGALIGRDAPFVSRLKSGEKQLSLEEFADLITGIGLEICSVAEDQVTVDRDLYESVTCLARLALSKSTMEAGK